VPDLVGDVKVKKDAEDISLPAGTSDRAATTSGEDDEYSDEEEDDDLSTTSVFPSLRDIKLAGRNRLPTRCPWILRSFLLL